MAPECPQRAPPTRSAACEAAVIHLSELAEIGATGVQAVHEALDRAFDAKGLGVICVAGDEAFQAKVRSIREELLPLAWALERLPAAARDAIGERGTLNVSNYSRGLDGNRSGFYFHPFTDHPGDSLPPGVGADPTFYTPNLWPDEALPALKVQARQASAFLVEVAQLLAAAVDRRCGAALPGYAAGTLVSLMGQPDSCNHKCRLLCYHEYDSDEHRAKCKGMWAPPHKDTGLLTALVPGVFLDTETGKQLPSCPHPEVGLYVRDRTGAIAQISIPKDVGDCLLFQVGEALQIVSGGLYQATEHCVRGPPRPNAGYVRASLAVFFQPHAHEDLVLPEGVSWQGAAERVSDGLFRMFLHYQPADSRGINFLKFCHREGF